MLLRLREIMLTQYIGAIVTALMAVDGIGNIIQAIFALLEAYRTRRQSVLTGTSIDWGFAVPYAVKAALYLLIFYLLVRWLYLRNESRLEGNDDSPTESAG